MFSLDKIFADANILFFFVMLRRSLKIIIKTHTVDSYNSNISLLCIYISLSVFRISQTALRELINMELIIVFWGQIRKINSAIINSTLINSLKVLDFNFFCIDVYSWICQIKNFTKCAKINLVNIICLHSFYSHLSTRCH